MRRRHLLIFVALWTALTTGCNRGPWSSGDRVLVSKCMYDTGISKPERFDVVVFKYPVRPIERGVPKNYIKRLLGLPGEILAILFGRIFFMSPEEGGEPFFPEPKVLTTAAGRTVKGFVVEDKGEEIIFEVFDFRFPSRRRQETFAKDEIATLEPIAETERWKHRKGIDLEAHARESGTERTVDDTDFDNDFDFLYEDHPKMWKWFKEGKFKILRKSPDVMLAMRRNVYDNDFQPKDLVGDVHRRWLPAKGGAWKTDDATGFFAEPKAAKDVEWLRYRHLPRYTAEGLKGLKPQMEPQLITDEFGYNSVESASRAAPKGSWVGDLMLECTLEVLEPKGEFWLELSRGVDRFRAKFDLATGQCTLYRESTVGKEAGKEVELSARDTAVKAKGTYQIRFANFCSRLTVWVDRALPFDKGHDYDPPDLPRPDERTLDDEELVKALAARRGPTKNDYEPASVGVNGAAVRITQLRLWRDTYYTRKIDSRTEESVLNLQLDTDLDLFRKLQPKFYYVQPKHYMCLGDNSPMSSDGREWGLVPERLMLGRAHMVYFPFGRAGPIK